jgi:Ca2+-binding EF-hand superfamily protein
MEGMDLNKDGRVTWDEFVAAAAERSALLNEANIDAIFSVMDKNSDGQITLEEMKEYFDDSIEDMWKDILAEVDKDGRGAITKANFLAAMKDVLKVQIGKLHDHINSTPGSYVSIISR